MTHFHVRAVSFLWIVGIDLMVLSSLSRLNPSMPSFETYLQTVMELDFLCPQKIVRNWFWNIFPSNYYEHCNYYIDWTQPLCIITYTNFMEEIVHCVNPIFKVCKNQNLCNKSYWPAWCLWETKHSKLNTVYFSFLSLFSNLFLFTPIASSWDWKWKFSYLCIKWNSLSRLLS